MTLLTDLDIIPPTKYLNFGGIFAKVVKCKLDIMPLNVFWSILWKMGVSYRKEYKVGT